MPFTPPPIPDPASDALFLDFDGTLVGFADDPDAVDVPHALKETLAGLREDFTGALALVSGRAVASIDRLLAPLDLPVAGVHGLEFRRRDRIEANTAEERRLAPARAHVGNAIGPDDPIRIEDKGGAIVLHFRTAPEAFDRARRIAEEAAARDEGLVAVAGHAITEIRPRAVTKAGAILRYLEEPPFAGRRPIFVGDDLTDEDGFRAAAEAGGFGIKVGPGDTVAPYRLSGVEAVRDWLASTRRAARRK